MKIFESILPAGISSDSVIDASCTRQNWLLYGSRKSNTAEYYQLTKIYDDQGKELSLGEAFLDFPLKDTTGDEIKFDEDEISYYLPRILSIDPEDRPVVFAKADLPLLSKITKSVKDIKDEMYEDMPIGQALARAKKLVLSCISHSRADDYDQWWLIGAILYSIGDGCKESFNIWLEFSKRTKNNNFSEKACHSYWKKMIKKEKNEGGATIGTLMKYAKEDNPEEFDKLMKADEENNVNESLLGGHADMAKILHRKYKTKYCCGSIKHKVWYKFENHGWIIMDEGEALQKKIINDLTSMYKDLKMKYQKEMADDEENAENSKKKLSK